MENSLVYRILRIEGSADYSRCTCLNIDLHALIMNNFDLRVLCIEPISLLLLYKGVVVGVLNSHRDKKS